MNKRKIIDVLAFFKGGKIDPIKFIYGPRAYSIHRVTACEYGVVEHTFTVETEEHTAVIQFSITTKSWELLQMEKRNGERQNH